MAAGGGGAWKVAYADFVTAMMAFFMVMWLTSQKPQLKEAIAESFRDPFATEPGTGGYNSSPSARAKGKDKKKAKDPGRVLAGGAGVQQDGPSEGERPGLKSALAPPPEVDAMRVTVQFHVGEAKLTDEQRERLRRSLPAIAGKRFRLELRAHCLLSPLPAASPFKDHWQLCYARCRAVQTELEALGIERERFRLSQAEANEPMTTSLAEDEVVKNSRVDIFLLPEIAATMGTPEHFDGDDESAAEEDELVWTPAKSGEGRFTRADAEPTAGEPAAVKLP